MKTLFTFLQLLKNVFSRNATGLNDTKQYTIQIYLQFCCLEYRNQFFSASV